MRRSALLFLGAASLLAAAVPARAVITALTPLSGQINENPIICTVVVETVDPDKPGMVLAVDEVLKGKPTFKKLAVNLTGDADSQEKKERPVLLKRVAPKLPLVVFVNQNGKSVTAFAYSNGTWFQMAGEQADDGDVLRLPFTHLEPYLRRTYKGTTAEMKQVVVDALAGKAEPPDPNLKEKPGVGPEVETPDKRKEEVRSEEGGVRRKAAPCRSSSLLTSHSSLLTPYSSLLTPPSSFRLARGPVFGVIPMLVVGPLALLAMLFPAVFGGLMLVLRRWTTALTVLSVNSLLLFFQDWFNAYLITSWWGTPAALWLVMSLVTVCGALWAWRKHAARLAPIAPTPAPRNPGAYAPGSPTSTQFTWSRPMARTVEFFPPPKPARFEPPHKGEMIALGVLSLLFLAAGFFLPRSLDQFGVQAKAVVMFAAGVWAATLHACYLRWVVARRRAPRPGLPGEGVLLGVMLIVGVVFSFTLAPESQASPVKSGDAKESVADARDAGERVTRLGEVRELFSPKPSSWIASPPRVVGDRVYVGAVHGEQYQSGALYCLNRATGAVIWAFNNGGQMKNAFSAPFVVGDRLYVGEGFHQNTDCKLFCLNADTGAKIWDFPTRSHTESSPCVVDGKVYFGAGDDGLYCVDAADGKPAWDDATRLKGLHVDANPLVVGGRVYCGSGVGDAYRETCVFCLDAATGKEIWRRPTDLPVWGESALADGRLYVPIGNGNMMASEDKPAGALLCLDAAAGEQKWRRDAADGVLVRPSLDRGCVYFASRDQNCYCCDRADGRVLWKKDLGAPVTASPLLVRCPDCGGGEALYVVASDVDRVGLAYCLDPATGAEMWRLDLGKGRKSPALFSAPTAAVNRDGDMERRSIYFGGGFNFFRRGVLFCVEDATGKPGAK
jgi:outer membrane protein assembly factor BamB